MGTGRYFAILSGLVVALCLLEAGLRVLGLACAHRDSAVRAALPGEGRTILCLGDSFTWGAGAPAHMSWPRQLECLLNADGEARYAVVNRGMGGQNTARLLLDLKRNLASVHPDLVVLCTGSANRWDSYGQPTSDGAGGWRTHMRDALYRVRVFRLAKLLYLRACEAQAKAQKARRLAALEARRSAFQEAVAQAVPPERRSLARTSHDRGHQHLGACRTSEALACHREGIAADPHNADNFVGMAECFSQQGVTAQALGWCRKAVEADPYSVHARTALARLLRTARHHDEAMDVLEEAREMAPRDPLVLRETALTCAALHRHAEALSCLQEALECDPQHRHDILLDRSQVHEQMEDFKSALADAEEALRARPDDDRCRLRAARMHQVTGAHDKAIPLYTATLRRHPHFMSMRLLGDCLRDAGRLPEALEWYEKAAALNPKDVAEVLADTYRQAGQEPRALAWYGRALELNPGLEREIRGKMTDRSTAGGKTVHKAPRSPGAGDAAALVEAWIRADVLRIVACCREAGVPVLLHSYPGETVRKDLLASIAAEAGVPFVDHQPAFQALPEPGRYFAPDFHCNELGYGLMARNLQPKVLELLSAGAAGQVSGAP